MMDGTPRGALRIVLIYTLAAAGWFVVWDPLLAWLGPLLPGWQPGPSLMVLAFAAVTAAALYLALRREPAGRAPQGPVQTEGEAPGRDLYELLRAFAYEYRLGADGTLQLHRMTEGFAAVTGFRPEEVEARGGWTSLVHPDDAPLVRQRTDHLLSGRAEVSEYRIVTKSGQVRWLRDYARGVRDEAQGRVVRLYGAAQDVTEQKLAEGTLRQYQLLFENSRDAMLVVHLPDGRIQQANDAALLAYGYTRDELASLTLLDLHAPQGRPSAAAQLAQAGSAGLQYETRHRRKDGRLFPVEVSLQGIAVADERALVCVTRDLTGRIQAEEALRDSESRYRTLAEAAQDMIFIIDRDDYVRYANSFAAGQFRMQPGDIVGRRRSELFPPDVSGRQRRSLQRVFDTGQPVYVDSVVSFRPGEEMWLGTWLAPMKDPAGDVTAVLGISRDITEQKQAEEALRASEERLRTVITNAPIILFALDRHGVFTFSEGMGLEALDLRPGEVIGRSALELYRNSPPVVDAIRRALGGETLHAVEMPARGLAFEVSVAPLRDANGEVVAATGVAIDITERKRAEEAALEQQMLAESLRDIAAALSSTLEFDAVLDRILANVGRVVPHESANIMLIEGDMARVVRRRGGGDAAAEAAILALRLPYAASTALRQIVESGQPLVVPDTREYPGWTDLPETRWIRSYAGMPVRSKQNVIGFLNLNSSEPGFFTAAHVDRLQAFADQTATAVENARLYEAVRRQIERAEALARAASRLNVQLDLARVLETVCEETARALNVPVAGISLYDGQLDALVPVAGFGVPRSTFDHPRAIPRTSFQQAIQHQAGPVAVIADVQNAAYRSGIELYGTFDARTIAIANLQREGQLIGILAVLTAGATRFLSENEQALLAGLADQAALAIANARLYDEAQRRLKRVQTLRDIESAISASVDLRVTLSLLLDQVSSQLGVDAACVLLLDHHTQTLTYAAGRGFRSRAIERTFLRLGQGYAGRAALERSTLRIADLTAGDDPDRASLLAGESFVAYYGVPLVAKGRVTGVLEIFHRAALSPDEEWLAFLETLAGQAAIAINNAELFNDLQRSNLELALAYEATIEGWSRALDLRDRETEGHTQRVADMTLHLAHAMSVGDAELVHIRRGALLHDIGKMGIPDSILLKPDRLTSQEWEIMRRHPTYAYEMLSPIRYLHRSLDIPYCHHEKWDGTGYPRGLKGEQIPLSARIFAVVDVYDALRSNRPYRAAWAEEDVRVYIREQIGKHFSPDVVAVFLHEFCASPGAPRPV